MPIFYNRLFGIGNFMPPVYSGVFCIGNLLPLVCNGHSSICNLIPPGYIGLFSIYVFSSSVHSLLTDTHII